MTQMKDEYISISEFARRAGVSRQAIQQRLNTSLREFVKVAQGKKLLNIKGLEIFDGARVAQGSKPIEESVIELLRQELAAKDKQIEALQKMLDQEQQLHAATTQRLLLLEQPKQDAPAPISATPPEPERPWWQFWK